MVGEWEKVEIQRGITEVDGWAVASDTQKQEKKKVPTCLNHSTNGNVTVHVTVPTLTT